jgi:hypothetical protein
MCDDCCEWLPATELFILKREDGDFCLYCRECYANHRSRLAEAATGLT